MAQLCHVGRAADQPESPGRWTRARELEERPRRPGQADPSQRPGRPRRRMTPFRGEQHPTDAVLSTEEAARRRAAGADGRAARRPSRCRVTSVYDTTVACENAPRGQSRAFRRRRRCRTQCHPSSESGSSRSQTVTVARTESTVNPSCLRYRDHQIQVCHCHGRSVTGAPGRRSVKYRRAIMMITASEPGAAGAALRRHEVSLTR